MIRGLLKFVAFLLAIVVIATGVAFLGMQVYCSPPPVAAQPPPPLVDDAGYRRDPANTYLTFPEWYIVYSFEDFGRFLENHSESEFPYVSQIAGFWTTFCAAHRIAGSVPGDHGEYVMMDYIIGLSFSFELAIKGAWENTIGRITEWIRGPRPNPEDIYARRIVQDYARFMYQTPWYKYPFVETFRGLWREMPAVTGNPVRSIERKVALSSEYLVKAGYGSLIGLAVTAGGGDEHEIMFVVQGDAASILADAPDVSLVRPLPGGMSLLIAPRYAAFTDILMRLAAKNVQIVEIAGNRRILVSIIVGEGAIPEVPGAQRLFTVPVDALPGFVRVGYDVDVGQLTPVLNAYREQNVDVEHIYDY